MNGVNARLRHSKGVGRQQLCHAREPAGRYDKCQSEIGELLAMRDHSFPHECQTRNIDVMAPGYQCGLRNSIPPLGYPAAPGPHNRTLCAKFLQRPRITNVNTYRSDSATKVRCNTP